MTGSNSSNFDWSQGDPAYGQVLAEETAVVEMSETIALAMELRDVSRAELARRCDVTPSAITQRLRGDTNTTVRKLAALLDALDYDVRFELIDRATGQRHQVHDHDREKSYDGLLKLPTARPWDEVGQRPARRAVAHEW